MELQVTDPNLTYDPDHKFTAKRASFRDAAQDSYTVPPSQNPDWFEQLYNTLPGSVQGVLQRRWGYQLWSSDNTVNRRLYEFHQQNNALRRILGTAADGTGTISSTNKVIAYNEDGTIFNPTVFTPASGATSPRVMSSRDYAFFADGVQADLQKWDGSANSGLSKWGITAPVTAPIISPILGNGSRSFALTSVANASGGNTVYTGTGLTGINVGTTVAISGFNNSANNGTFVASASTSTTVTVNNPSGVAETTNATVITQNSFYPTVSLNGWGPNGHVGGYEGGTNQGFNFGLDAGTTGAYSNATSAFDGKTDTFSSAVYQHTHQYAGCVWGFATPGTAITSPILNILSEVPSSGTDGKTVTLRSAGIWYSLDAGATWTQIYNTTPSTVTAGLLTVSKSVARPKQWDTITLPASQDLSKVQVMAFMDAHDDMYHKVYEINIQATAIGSGSVTLTKGRNYFLAFQNSVSGGFSDLSPVSNSTGAVLGGTIPLQDLAVSGDPQVDKKVLLATADGGDTNTLYLVAQLSNATTTYLDSTPELTLLAANVYNFIDAGGNNFGLLGNQPPPNGQFPTKHRGRSYLLQGENLFFSKNIAEVTTPTGVIAGRYEEAWPAFNQMDVSNGAEVGRCLLSDGDFLYIGTDRHVLRLIGDGPSNFQPPQTAFNEGGVLNQDCWRSVYLDGQPIGCMWVTPDFRVVQSDFNTHLDVGTPIQDVLNSINPNATANVTAQYFAFGAYNFYVLAIPTGGNTDADTLCVYDLKQRRWFIWFPTDKATSLLYNINAAGVPQMILWSSAAVSSRGYKFVPGLVQDRVSNTPVSFTCTARTSWLDFGDGTLRKVLNWMQVTSDDSNITVSIHGASNASEFGSADLVVSNATFKTSPFGDLSLYLAGKTSKDRYYRLTFQSTSTSLGFLRGFNVRGFGLHTY